jgi:hypothetical protein
MQDSLLHVKSPDEGNGTGFRNVLVFKTAVSKDKSKTFSQNDYTASSRTSKITSSSCHVSYIRHCARTRKRFCCALQ